MPIQLLTVSLPITVTPGIPFSISVSRSPPPAELRLEVHPPDPHAEIDILELAELAGGHYLATAPRSWGGPRNWVMWHQEAGAADARFVGRGVIDIHDSAGDLARLRACIDEIEAIFADGARVDRQSITLPDGRSISNTPRASLEMILHRMRASYATILRTTNARSPFEITKLS